MQRAKIIRIADEADAHGMIQDRLFEDAEIRGPAMLTPAGSLTIEHCDWDAPFDQMFHATEKAALVGVIGLSNVTFRRCAFRSIGFLAHPNFIQVARRCLGNPDSQLSK